MGKKILVIGGVAAGPKAAARARRLDPSAEITIVEKDEILSYAGCGLPYYISGMVKERKELIATSVGVLRDPQFFAKVKHIKVLNRPWPWPSIVRPKRSRSRIWPLAKGSGCPTTS